MSLRQIFLLLVAPLFVLLAGVNGALLYVWEHREAARGLESQALAAAVTTAAFAASTDDLAQVLAQPTRVRALEAAAANITGLDGLYVARPGAPTRRIAGAGAHASLAGLSAPRAPVALPIRKSAGGYRVATALAPAANGEYVIAQIDAEPLFAQMDVLNRLIAGLMAGAGLLGVLLAWTVAGRIRRELSRNSELVEAIREGRPAQAEGLGIRETRDLAQAVGLMQTSVAGRIARNDRELAARDRDRDESAAAADYREGAFPPLSTRVAGVDLAVRMLGAAPAGAFYALCRQPDRAVLVLGVCEGGGPADSLAQALAARRYFERETLAGAPAEAIARGRSAFGVSQIVWRDWRDGDVLGTGPQVLALLDGDKAARAAAYAAQAQDLSPEAVMADLTALLAASGVLAVLGQGGQG